MFLVFGETCWTFNDFDTRVLRLAAHPKRISGSQLVDIEPDDPSPSCAPQGPPAIQHFFDELDRRGGNADSLTPPSTAAVPVDLTHGTTVRGGLWLSGSAAALVEPRGKWSKDDHEQHTPAK
jgi:hypothetical protein